MALICLATLLGYWWLSGSATELEVEARTWAADRDTVVLITLQSLRTVDYEVDVKVLVFPPIRWSTSAGRAEAGHRRTAASVNTLGDLKFPAGSAPAETAVVDVDGDVNAWPFDTYRTDGSSADLLIGEGDDRRSYRPGWRWTDLFRAGTCPARPVTPSPQAKGAERAMQITMSRALGPLAFDLGIVLVLLTLPTLAIFTALLVITRRKQFQIAFATWYAAMLFAVVPLRNILPGAPPPGAWIDVALVLPGDHRVGDRDGDGHVPGTARSTSPNWVRRPRRRRRPRPRP
jgi:hypothetical protein